MEMMKSTITVTVEIISPRIGEGESEWDWGMEHAALVEEIADEISCIETMTGVEGSEISVCSNINEAR